MSLVKAEKDSMASDATSNNAPEGGDPGKLGYTLMSATGGPATSNKEISMTKKSIGANDEEDGTSLDSYSYQKGSSADGK